MRALKRLRGGLLRLALNRAFAIAVGLSLMTPAVWLMIADLPWETSTTDGVSLIIGATGAAFVFAGIGGRRPDWR